MQQSSNYSAVCINESTEKLLTEDRGRPLMLGQMMEKRGAKVVSIANTDDKRQLTTVLTVTASGEYLEPQLLYKGKATVQKGEIIGIVKIINQMKRLPRGTLER